MIVGHYRHGGAHFTLVQPCAGAGKWLIHGEVIGR